MFRNRRPFLGYLPTGNVLFEKGFGLGFEKFKISNLVKYSQQPEQISSSSEMLTVQKWLESWEGSILAVQIKSVMGPWNTKSEWICHRLQT